MQYAYCNKKIRNELISKETNPMWERKENISMNGGVLEICCDASMHTYSNGRSFGCAGAIAIGVNQQKQQVVPDCTNNIAELTAMLLAVQLAYELSCSNKYDDIFIYSDSIFTVKGLTVWMEMWLRNTHNGVMYNSQGVPVANQNMFKKIITYLVMHNLHVHIRHIKGHINVSNQKQVDYALQCFYRNNGYSIDLNTLTRILLYNNIIDNSTRETLKQVNQNIVKSIEIADFIYNVPTNFKDYVV